MGVAVQLSSSVNDDLIYSSRMRRAVMNDVRYTCYPLPLGMLQGGREARRVYHSARPIASKFPLIFQRNSPDICQNDRPSSPEPSLTHPPPPLLPPPTLPLSAHAHSTFGKRSTVKTVLYWNFFYMQHLKNSCYKGIF